MAITDAQFLAVAAEQVLAHELLPESVVRSELEQAAREAGKPAPAQPVIGEGATEADDDPEADALNSVIYTPPDTPDGYRFELGDIELTTENIASLNQIRGVLHAEGVPAALALQADKLIVEGLRNPPDELALRKMAHDGRAALARRFGDDLPHVLSAARRQFDLLADKVPGLREAVERSGAGSNPWFLASLFTMSQVRRK